MKKKINLTIDESLYEDLQEIHYFSISELVNALLTEWIEENTTRINGLKKILQELKIKNRGFL